MKANSSWDNFCQFCPILMGDKCSMLISSDGLNFEVTSFKKKGNSLLWKIHNIIIITMWKLHYLYHCYMVNCSCSFLGLICPRPFCWYTKVLVSFMGTWVHHHFTSIQAHLRGIYSCISMRKQFLVHFPWYSGLWHWFCYSSMSSLS